MSDTPEEQVDWTEDVRRLCGLIDARKNKEAALHAATIQQTPANGPLVAGTALGVTGKPSRFDKEAPEAGYAGGLTFELPRQGGK